MAADGTRGLARHLALHRQGQPAGAKSFGKELREKTKTLARHPELGRHGRPGLPEWLRELIVHPNYIVFYRVLAQARTVEILRVKHAAQKTP